MRVIYWCDIIDEEESIRIKKEATEAGIVCSDFIVTANPQEAIYKDTKFDILLFDWGGMSMGNDMMDHFCKDILDHAKEHPSRIYIMVSSFTGAAMKDMIDGYPESEEISNVFLDFESAKSII